MVSVCLCVYNGRRVRVCQTNESGFEEMFWFRSKSILNRLTRIEIRLLEENFNF